MQRREPTYDAITRDSGATSFVARAYAADDADAILADLVRHSSAISVPWFVPMREAIESGFSFEKEPRLLGILPIGTKSTRDKLAREATFAARVFRWVSASDGVVSKEEQRMIIRFFAAIGMPNDLAEPLLREPPAPTLSAIEKPADIDVHIAEAIVRGAHDIAEQDGLDEREDIAVNELAKIFRRFRVLDGLVQSELSAAPAAYRPGCTGRFHRRTTRLRPARSPSQRPNSPRASRSTSTRVCACRLRSLLVQHVRRIDQTRDFCARVFSRGRSDLRAK